MTSLADSLRFQKCRPFDSRLLPFCETPTQELIYKTYGQSGSIVNEAARRLKMDPSQVSKSVRTIQYKGRAVVGFLETNDVGEVITQDLNILIFDIETAPHEVYVFDFYNQNISHEQVKTYGHVLSFAAKWFGSDEIIYDECRTKNDKRLIHNLIDLFDKADVLVAHNGKAFDVKKVRGRAVKHETIVPSTCKIVDTFLISKNEFKFDRNSLEFIAEYLGCTPKLKHGKYPGIVLWKEVLKNNPDAWEQLREYNIGDLRTLEEVYIKLRKWITTHPNLGNLLSEERQVCPKCGSGELAPINAIKTNTQVYPGYRCKNCGGLCRGRYTIATKEKRRSILVNAA